MIAKFKLSLVSDKPTDKPIATGSGEYVSDEWVGESIGQLVALARKLGLKPNMCVFTVELNSEEWAAK